MIFNRLENIELEKRDNQKVVSLLFGSLNHRKMDFYFSSVSDVLMEENHYYPFGLKHQKYTNPLPREIVANEDETTKAIVLTDPALDAAPYRNYDYKYNGKEWQDELGLNMYDMDMRMYDPVLARWVVMDPVIHHSMSPYNAFDNNPVFWADPSGADAVLYGEDAQEFIRRERKDWMIRSHKMLKNMILQRITGGAVLQRA